MPTNRISSAITPASRRIRTCPNPRDNANAVAAVSSRTLIRHFRDATGLTPLAYIQKARVEEAKSLLSTGNLAPQKIVDRVGDADMNSFRRLFREHTGMTPHDYREKFRVRARPAQMASAGETLVPMVSGFEPCRSATTKAFQPMPYDYLIRLSKSSRWSKFA